MTSSRWTRSRRRLVVATALFTSGVIIVVALTTTRASEADDVYRSLGARYSVLESTEAPGVHVVSATGDSDQERRKLSIATPANPVIFADGPVDTGRVRRADARRDSRGLKGASKVQGVWVAPSKYGGICVIVTVADTKGAGGSCTRSGASMGPSTMLIFGNGTNGIDAGETVFAGAVADDVDAVQIKLADGTAATIPIVENAFSFDTTIAIQSYRFITAEGATDPTTVENPNA